MCEYIYTHIWTWSSVVCGDYHIKRDKWPPNPDLLFPAWCWNPLLQQAGLHDLNESSLPAQIRLWSYQKQDRARLVYSLSEEDFRKSQGSDKGQSLLWFSPESTVPYEPKATVGGFVFWRRCQIKGLTALGPYRSSELFIQRSQSMLPYAHFTNKETEA